MLEHDKHSICAASEVYAEYSLLKEFLYYSASNWWHSLVKPEMEKEDKTGEMIKKVMKLVQ